MTRSTLLTIKDLINELNLGKATLKFILHQFSPWIPTQIVNNETYYTEQAVTTLLKIKKFLDTGMLPDQIETFLAQEAEMLKAAAKYPTGNPSKSPIDLASASMLKDMFQVYIEKQDRIAQAQENLVRVEDRKADAMEKRAAAEEKKADALTNIARALQEMNQRHSTVPQAMEVAGRAVESIALEESPEPAENLLDTHFDKNEYFSEDPLPMEDPFQDQDHEDIGDTVFSNLDDLSLLVNETALTPEDIDDLSSLINSVSDPSGTLDDLESLLDETPSTSEVSTASHDMDDLSKLVDPDDDTADDKNENDLDDLFSLVDMEPDVPKDVNESIDDLSWLIEPERDTITGDLDDLSALIEKPEQTQEMMDDLSLLVDDADKESGQATSGDAIRTDDLWALVPNADNSSPKIQGQGAHSVDASEMDNLSALIDIAPDDTAISDDTTSGGHANVDNPTESTLDTPSIKPNISPDQDMKSYKAAVMKIIIGLKEQGLTAQETTDRLNRDDVATLSGKPTWGLKAIEKIYGFINSAK
ncbi:MerR family transcriptional regulator [uncultured Desulfobacter sp.]|uniref:MerR family transcriptional regulator n=1 Tax=uncultured Desulfobacter sp. TaxID=240139 RepID=UPI0029F58435|nr:MerR family transcriptional regulator [uncultured Desulfobacter sp.]